MIERVKTERLKRILLEEARADTVGLWAILWQAKEDAASLSSAEAKQVTLAVIRELLAEKQIVAGVFVDQDEDTAAFVTWPLSAEEAVARIEREWAILGREPSLGEVVWFAHPSLLPLAVHKRPMGRDWKPRAG